ncbi:hypothetical protein SDC9_114063 [bioreactor metagenome]|uniref:Uncharacterized protein n=1 Tax=bioreactor metagenome TaxID=1076179 RepID=A0A645BP47_9ZZZZ
MRVEVEVDDGAFKLCAKSLIKVEAGTGHSCGGLRVKDVEILADVPVSFRLKVKGPGSAPPANFDIVVRALACRYGIIRDIGDIHQQRFDFGIECGKLRVVLFDLFRQRLHFGHDFGRVLPRFLHLGDFSRDLILFGFALFVVIDDGAAALIQSQYLVDVGRVVGAAQCKSFFDVVGILFNSFNIQHDVLSLVFFNIQNSFTGLDCRYLAI